eukprot:UN34765
MKVSHIEYHRLNPKTKEQLKSLKLSENFTVSKTQKRRKKGCVHLPKRELEFKDVSDIIKNCDVLKYKKVTNVMLELSGVFAKINQQSLINTKTKPMSIPKYQELQSEWFCEKLDELLVDWREMAMNRIRDLDVGGGFNLFVRDEKVFDASPLKRFFT